jgi:hypothetical protein
MNRDDIAALRTPLAALAITLLVTGGVIVYSNAFLDEGRRLLTQREMQLREARLRIQNADAEKEMITRYAGAYQQLIRTGFAAEEQRIDWLDGLRLANEHARTSGVEYYITAQRPYAYAAEFSAAPLQLNESLMQVRLRLAHEEELPRFFDALASHGGGFFTIDRCVLRRLPLGDAESGHQAQQRIAAECDLRWLTARLASEKK